MAALRHLRSKGGVFIHSLFILMYSCIQYLTRQLKKAYIQTYLVRYTTAKLVEWCTVMQTWVKEESDTTKTGTDIVQDRLTFPACLAPQSGHSAELSSNYRQSKYCNVSDRVIQGVALRGGC